MAHQSITNSVTIDEQDDLDHAEMIPLMMKAIQEAYDNALASGYSVLVAKNGAIERVHPDGTREFVKAIKPPVKVVPGTKVRIKWIV
ncbi:MAG: hypothetical protein JSS66_07850 [Armatimonadetes bacterium]|nr:hypothetical protein [Armatimonadota bacterium]